MGRSDQRLSSSKHRYQVIPRVLVFLRNDSDVLLLKGAPSKKLWANLYNGVGGHVEADEDVFSAARREVVEETGIDSFELHLKAVVNIDASEPGLGIMMFVFVGSSWQRETVASVEGELHWVPIRNLGSYDLVEDLKWLLPRILQWPEDTPPKFFHYSYDLDDSLVIRPA